MRKVIFLLLAFIIIISSHNFINASQTENKIRVGLESNKNLLIKNKEIYIGFEDKFIKDKFSAGNKNNFKLDINKKFYIDTQSNYNNYQETLLKKNDFIKKNKNQTVICFNNINSWSIYLGPFDSLEKANLANKNINGKIINPDKKKLFLLESDKTCLLINNNSFRVKACDSSGLINLDDKKYRDTIEFILVNKDKSKIIPVNILPLNKYLYGVLPSEMPTNWPEEALKAQAIVARTYALKSLELNKHEYYDLCDCVHCQNYLGANSESNRVNKIIDKTFDLCIYNNNKLINATFFSSSGGATENSEDVWIEKFDYLRGKKNPPSLKEISKSWTYEFTGSQIKKNLSKKNIDIGDILDIKILETLPSGRVSKLLVSGSSGEKIFYKEEIRKVFCKSNGQMLDSRLFKIDSSDINSDYKIKLSGTGFGHGVGLSQYGAKAMAESDYNYLDIIKYYYTDVEIK